MWSTMSNLRHLQLAKRRRRQNVKLHVSSESYQDALPTKMLRPTDVVFLVHLFWSSAQFYNVENMQGPNVKGAEPP